MHADAGNHHRPLRLLLLLLLLCPTVVLRAAETQHERIVILGQVLSMYPLPIIQKTRYIRIYVS